MMKIQSYDSRASISEYTIGHIYSFYIHKSNINHLIRVREKDFNVHIETLNSIIEDNENLIPNNESFPHLTRAIGIVVDKHKSIHINETDSITVIFKTDDNHYVLNKYAVKTHNVFTNEKDIMIPSAVIPTVEDWD